MFQINLHQKNYQYDYVTVIDNILPNNICEILTKRINDIINAGVVPLVNHEGLGNNIVTDKGGKYLHHIFKGAEIREYLPELHAVYHSLLPLI
ncbi:MAG: hypothetical protein ACK5WP_00200 [Neisseriaceae bacterium]|jgi:hypothetical protein